jgi:type VI secretion system protein ImpE
MSRAKVAEQTLKNGDPVTALAELQDRVRAEPADPELRIFLFQLLCVLGHWERALNQLAVATNLDPSVIAMAQTYGEAVRCEAIRDGVFAGKKSPMIFGEPDQWLAFLIESLLAAGHGQPERSEELRSRALADAPTADGTIDGRPFAWIADADSRLGPVLEAVINGRYYWVPFARLVKVDIDEPKDLRDVVWMPAHFTFENGGESVALIPTRYPGSAASEDGLIQLARKTVWKEIAPDVHCGLGQRILATDADDMPLMDVRTISLVVAQGREAELAGGHG